MHSFVRKLITEWRRIELPLTGRAVVAVSGGADSVSLLLAVIDLVARKKLELRVVVAHFDHGLRGEASDADAAFVKELSESLGLECVSIKGRVGKTGNIEQNARNARYEFLVKTAKDAAAFGILTGHTISDQAETFLMNLVRGSGPDGLRAMPAVRQIDDGLQLIRPLLTWAKREDTEAFCRESKVDFRHDAMNDDPAFRRVRIRKEVLPLLRELNPKIVEILAATAALMPECDAPSIGREAELSVSYLTGLEADHRNTAVRDWLKQRRGSLRRITREHIAAVARLSISRKSGREVELPGGESVVKSGGKLWFRAAGAEE